MKMQLRALLVAAIAVAAPSLACAQITIDNFSVPLSGGDVPGSGILSSSSGSSPDSSANQALGGGVFRLTTTTQAGGGSTSAQVDTTFNPDRFVAGNTGGAGTITATYTFGAIPLTGAASVDFNVVFVDDGSPDTAPTVKVEIVDNNGTFSLGTQNVTSTGLLSFSLAGLAAGQKDVVTGLNFVVSLANAADLHFSGDTGVRIREIPEPASLTLLGILAAGGWIVARRRRVAA